VRREIEYYNLDAILSVGSRVNISLHINNCFKEKELEKPSTVKESLTIQKEGHRSVKHMFSEGELMIEVVVAKFATATSISL